MAQAGQTDLLVAGDKDLLSLSSHQGTRILTAREALGLLGRTFREPLR